MNDPKSRTLLNTQDVRKYINQWSSKGFSRIRGLGDKIRLGEIQTKPAHTVSLKTQYEERTVARSSVPHEGGPVDESVTPTGPWDIPFERPTDFMEHEQKLLLPHTERVEACSSCGGKGKVNCPACHGTGGTTCPKCHGATRYGVHETRMVANVGRPGYTQKRELVYKVCRCMGGKVNCLACTGRGTKVCKDCQGRGALKSSSVLNVRFRVVTLTDFVNLSAVPDQLIQSSSGEVLHENRAARIGAFPGITDEVDRRTRNLLSKSGTVDEETHRILFQHLRLQRVPVHDVSYQYSNSGSKRLWIYGNENNVYAPNAPLAWKKLLMVTGAVTVGALVIILLIFSHK
jgi:hypothetical protein